MRRGAGRLGGARSALGGPAGARHGALARQETDRGRSSSRRGSPRKGTGATKATLRGECATPSLLVVRIQDGKGAYLCVGHAALQTVAVAHTRRDRQLRHGAL